jgi:hypothetical protein
MSDHPAPVVTPEPPITPPGHGWFQRVMSVLFVIFCLELGLFLLVYPWTDGWSANYFGWAAARGSLQRWHNFWNNTYVRGAISGLGAVNLWIALSEVFRMFARRRG